MLEPERMGGGGTAACSLPDCDEELTYNIVITTTFCLLSKVHLLLKLLRQNDFQMEKASP